MLSIRLHDGRVRPCLVCDKCGKIIEDWHQAGVQFFRGGEFKVVHEQCDDGGGDEGGRELEVYLRHLLQDGSSAPQHADHRADCFESF